MRHVGDVALALHRLPKPTIAKVRGVAVGAGCNMALGCDLVVASDNARFSEIFARRGLSIDFGGSWVLPRIVGMHRAKELALFADIIDAAEAERIGLVNRVVPDAEIDAFVDDWAARLGGRAADRPGHDQADARQLDAGHARRGARRRRRRPDGQLRHRRHGGGDEGLSSRSANRSSKGVDRLGDTVRLSSVAA